MKKEARTKPASQAGMGAICHDKGVTFRVWAPSAEAVYVTGTFNKWGEKSHPLFHEADGYWAADVADAKPKDEYKYIIINGEEKLYRNDPYARALTGSAGNTVIHQPVDIAAESEFRIADWNELIIYEMHIGTFNDEAGGRPGNFQDAIKRLPYLEKLGINAVEIMPPTEFPGGFSWGYNPSYPFAIEHDYGGPDGFVKFVKAAHERGIAVIVDVVYNHLGPSDLDLWRFDGWYENEGGGIYFYNDWKSHTPWGDTRPDFGRPEVRQYLRDNALMWLREYDVDGLRWDATAYIRNVEGFDNSPANDLPDGWTLMQWINNEIDAHYPWKISIAEDLRANEWLTKDEGAGGAGFDSQWDSNFVHPIREVLLAFDDAYRDMDTVVGALTAGYDGDAFKRIIYTESHDEVANGKARVPEEIAPGEAGQNWFAKKRATLGTALVLTTPGIPMMFQGQEFLTGGWFDDTQPLDWQEAEDFIGFARLHRDLIHLRRNVQGHTRGLTGQHIHISHVNNHDKVIAFQRWSEGGAGDHVVVVANFANRTVEDYVVGFPAAGQWKLRFDSHSTHYDQTYEGQVSQDVVAIEGDYDGLPAQAKVALAPYSVVIFSQDAG